VLSYAAPSIQLRVGKSDANRICFQHFEKILHYGGNYSIPADEVHTFAVLEPGEVVEVFTPPRGRLSLVSLN
jgi:hypothetical protein